MTETEAAPEEGIDLHELAAVLKREYEQADSYAQQIEGLQRLAFQYYEADIATFPAREGGSQIILPDVQESIDYMAQSVLRTFLSGDRVVEFEATDEADEQAVDDATAAIGYNFMRQQDGARILHDGLVDGLLKKIGVFKSAVETVEKVSCETVIVQSEEELAVMIDQSGANVEAVEQQPDGTLMAKIKRERIEKRFVDYAVPVTRFKFNPKARHEDEADYLCHDELKTRSELVEMGFDRDQVYSLPTYTLRNEQRENESAQLDHTMRDAQRPELQEVLFCDEYARIDLDNDGIAERVRVCRVENEILIVAETGEPAIETIEEQPFSVFCPFPRPHRLIGYSLADKVMDLQLIRSFFARQLADGMAFANMPRPVVDTGMADQDTYADILTPIPGSPIRVKGGAASVQALQNGFNAGQSLQVMEWLVGERESRTGITRLNQGLDADALNKTATGTALMQAQGQQGEEMIARQLAEAFSRLMRKKYRLMREEGEPFKVKVDGQYRMVDPRTWPEDVNVVVRVGLGSNSKDKRIQYRMALLGPLSESIQQGLSGPEHAFNWFDGMARDTGLGQGDEFMYDPQEGGMPQRPDPAAEAEKAKLQLEAHKADAQLQLEAVKSDAQLQAMRDKHALEMDQRREAAGLEAELAREKADMEAQIALYKIDKEAEIARHQASVQAMTQAHIAENRPGGRLDA